MLKRIRHPSPAMFISLVALFVALTGSAVAGTIVAHAKFADKAGIASNSLKLQGKTAAQVAALAPAPPPVSSVASLVTVKTASWSVNPSQGMSFTVTCDAGQKAIAGGYDNPNGDAIALDTHPSPDGGSWVVFLGNLSSTAGASGTVYAVCLK
jgi:hypothetical protein